MTLLRAESSLELGSGAVYFPGSWWLKTGEAWDPLPGGHLWERCQSLEISDETKHFSFARSSAQHSILRSRPGARREAGGVQQGAELPPRGSLQSSTWPRGPLSLGVLWDTEELGSNSQVHAPPKPKAFQDVCKAPAEGFTSLAPSPCDSCFQGDDLCLCSSGQGGTSAPSSCSTEPPFSQNMRELQSLPQTFLRGITGKKTLLRDRKANNFQW